MCTNQNDPFVTYLKSFGYNPIRTPRTNIHPLQLLVKEGRELTFIGDLSDVFSGRTPLPMIQADQIAASISGKRTGTLNIGIGISLLGNIIGALGGSKLGLNAAYKNARTAVFEFPEVLEDRTSIAKLDQYLAQADVNPNSTAIAQMLDADDIFVMTSCLKSKKFTLEARGEANESVGIDIPVIQQVASGALKVDTSSAASGKVTFDGNTPVVFGFQAVRLYFDQGRYTAVKPAAGVVARAMPPESTDGAERYVTDTAFASLTF